MIVDYEYLFTKIFTQKWLSTSFFTKYTVSKPYSGSFSSQSPSIHSPTLLLISSCNVHIKLVLFVQLHLVNCSIVLLSLRTLCFISSDLRPVNKTGWVFFLTILPTSVSLSSSIAFDSSSSFVLLQDPNSNFFQIARVLQFPFTRAVVFLQTWCRYCRFSRLDPFCRFFFIDWEGLNFCFIVCGVTVAACLFMCFRKQLFFLKRGPHVRHLYLWPEHKKSWSCQGPFTNLSQKGHSHVASL